MKENGKTINDMVLVFLSQMKMKFMKENGLIINKKLSIRFQRPLKILRN
jgi:hypothetical protein